MTPSTVARDLAEASILTRRVVTALGDAIHAAHVPASPSLARAIQAEQNLYDRIHEEFGLLTSTEAGARLGSRSAHQRNLALAARKDGRLLAIRRGRYTLYPGFQFGESGARPVIEELVRVGQRHGWSETGLVQWLMSPTTYLDGDRPVDVLEDATRLIQVAEASLGARW